MKLRKQLKRRAKTEVLLLDLLLSLSLCHTYDLLRCTRFVRDEAVIGSRMKFIKKWCTLVLFGVAIDCLQSAFSLKIRLVLISSSAIANHDIIII